MNYNRAGEMWFLKPFENAFFFLERLSRMSTTECFHPFQPNAMQCKSSNKTEISIFLEGVPCASFL